VLSCSSMLARAVVAVKNHMARPVCFIDRAVTRCLHFNRHHTSMCLLVLHVLLATRAARLASTYAARSQQSTTGCTALQDRQSSNMKGCVSVSVLPQVLDLTSITKRHVRIVACSAHTGEGLLEAFEWLVKDISSRIYLFGQ